MVQHIFEIIILILLFREVLGYKELEKGIFVAAGIAIAVVLLLIKACFDVYDFNVWLQRFLLVLPLLIPMLIFKGRKFNIIGVCICIEYILSQVTSIVFGVQQIAFKENFWITNSYIIAEIIIIIAILILRCYINSKNLNLYYIINKFNGLIFIFAGALFFIAEINGMYSNGMPNEEVALVDGINLIRTGVLGILVFLFFILFLITMYQKKEMNRLILLKDKCISEQTEQYKTAMNKERELRRFRHDYNAHMTAVSGLLANEEYDKLKEYIKSMGYFKEKFNLVNSGNIITDAVFNQYKELCDKDNIEFEISGKLPENFNMAETDLCVLFSNLMSNAYEAVAQCEKDSSIIRTQIRNNDDDVFIKLSNSVKGEVEFKNGLPVTDKPDRKNHGFGVENILEVVERNGGHVEWKQSDKGRFTADIMLNA